jgi:hypothetical protein
MGASYSRKKALIDTSVEGEARGVKGGLFSLSPLLYGERVTST